MDGAKATTIALGKWPPPKETPEQIVARGQQRLDAFLGGGAAGAKEKRACDGGDASEEPRRRNSRVEFEVVVTYPAVLARLLDAGTGEDPGFHAAEVSALLNIPRGPLPLYLLAKRAFGRQTGLMGDNPLGKGDDRARKDCVDATKTATGDKSRCRELTNGLCHLVNNLCSCCSGVTTFDSIRIGRVVFFRGLLEEVRINILKATPDQTPEQTGVMLAWCEGISVLQGDEPG
ncbi:MAG: hypothetical protein ACPGR8_13785 [Limisphaerales bacterium]